MLILMCVCICGFENTYMCVTMCMSLLQTKMYNNIGNDENDDPYKTIVLLGRNHHIPEPSCVSMYMPF